MLSIKKCLESYPFLLEYFYTVPESEILGNCSVTKYRQGSTIMHKNDSVDVFELVFSGSIKIMNEFEDGNKYIHNKLHAPAILGDIELMADSKKYKSAATVVASTEVYCLVVPAEIYLQWAEEYPKFLRVIAKRLAIRFFESSDNLGNDIRYSTKYNLGSVLVRLIETTVEERNIPKDKDYEITIAETRKQIADMIVVTERTINRTLKLLKEEEYISIKSHKIAISKSQVEKIKKEILSKKA